VKPPFTYFGGKTSIAERIVSFLPAHEHYVEPFAGSLAVLLAKPLSSMETVNDLDGLLVNFWRVLRDRPQDLERACALTPHSRAEHLAAFDLDGIDELELARRVWVRLTQGRGGHLHRGTGWRFYRDPRGSSASMPEYLAGYTSRIAPAARRLAAVSLECRPALELVERYGQHPACLIYADPPYLRSTRTWTNGHAYGHEMFTDAAHRELAGALAAAAAAVVLSGYASPLYEELYDGWHRAEISAFTGNAARNRDRIEVLWSNRPFPAVQGELADFAPQAERLPAAVPGAFPTKPIGTEAILADRP
jgi:DNA adenine methylase